MRVTVKPRIYKRPKGDVTKWIVTAFGNVGEGGRKHLGSFDTEEAGNACKAHFEIDNPETPVQLIHRSKEPSPSDISDMAKLLICSPWDGRLQLPS